VTIFNFHQVTPRLYRGGQPLDGEWAEIKALGVRRVLKLNESTTGNDQIAAHLGMELEVITIPDHDAQTTLPDVGILDRVDAAIMRSCPDGSDPSVFVHCTEGKDRTGIAIARYRVLRDRWPKSAALAEWDQYGSHRYAGLVAAWNEWIPTYPRTGDNTFGDYIAKAWAEPDQDKIDSSFLGGSFNFYLRKAVSPREFLAAYDPEGHFRGFSSRGFSSRGAT
jgi:Tyrosine phosphatase family